jgi:hypothetical protein
MSLPDGMLIIVRSLTGCTTKWCIQQETLQRMSRWSHHYATIERTELSPKLLDAPLSGASSK